jgi:hypothetical protein
MSAFFSFVKNHLMLRIKKRRFLHLKIVRIKKAFFWYLTISEINQNVSDKGIAEIALNFQKK